MAKANPWGHGDLNDRIIEAEDMRLPVVANLFKMIREIFTTVELIEAEGARKIAADEASIKLHKENSQ